MSTTEKRLFAELKAAEDGIFDLLVRVKRGDFSMEQVAQQLEQRGNDIRNGRFQLVQK